MSAHRWQSVLAPAPLWNLCWFLLFISGSVLGSDYNYDPTSVILLSIAALSFSLGCFFVDVTPAVNNVDRGNRLINLKIPTSLVWICAVVGFYGCVQLSRHLGTPLLNVRSIAELFDAGQQNAVLLFRGEAELTQSAKISFAALQIGHALAGARQRLSPTRGGTLAACGLVLVALLWNSVTTQRSYLLVPAVWFAAAYIAAATWQGARVLPTKVVYRAITAVVGLGVAVVFFRAIRVNGSDAGLSSEGLASAKLWVAGYIPTFSAWYARGMDGVGQSYGLLNGVLGILGGKGDPTGLGGYEDIGGGATSNAPTMMHSTFILAGTGWALMIMLLLGMVAQVVYLRAFAGDLVGGALYVGVVAGILWSINAWFFGYGGRVLAYIGIILAASFVAARIRQLDRRALIHRRDWRTDSSTA